MMIFRKSKTPQLVAGADPKGPLLPHQELPQPDFSFEPERVDAVTFRGAQSKVQWYPAPLVGAQTLARMIVESPEHYVAGARDLLRELSPDDYGTYMIQFYEAGLSRYGSRWGYADLVTIVLGLAEHLRPRRYLEIGVRRGRSVCAVGKLTPACEIAMFDMWLENYAGMENPGPDFVRAELHKVGHLGKVEFINGNSHETLPQYFSENPQKTFDLIAVDGDHTNLGAAQDIADVLPHLAIGGAIALDDISHPKFPGLKSVWQRMIVENPRFSAWTYDEVGYGVGFAVRKW